LTKKGFQWSADAQAAFDKMNCALVNTPVLALLNFDQPFAIETDACDTGVGAVLVRNGHPVAYFSKALGCDIRSYQPMKKSSLLSCWPWTSDVNICNMDHFLLSQIIRVSATWAISNWIQSYKGGQ
jgi:hypothetical protein